MFASDPGPSPVQRALRAHALKGISFRAMVAAPDVQLRRLFGAAGGDEWLLQTARPATFGDAICYVDNNSRPVTSLSLNLYGDRSLHLLWLIDDADAADLADRHRLVLPHWTSDGDLDTWARSLEQLADDVITRFKQDCGAVLQRTPALATRELDADLLAQVFPFGSAELVCLRAWQQRHGESLPAGMLLIHQA